MPISAPQNTLAFQLSRPFTAQRSLMDQPCSRVAQKITQFMEVDEDAGCCPEAEALVFYGMNHGMGLLAQAYTPFQPMTDEDTEFCNAYHKMLAEPTLRALYYTILITTRETRHAYPNAAHDNKLDATYGYSIRQFIRQLKGKHSEAAADLFKNNPPNGTIGKYAHALADTFHNNGYSGGYGGHPWGNVADTLARLTTGEFSMEMFMDTVWTLCHNNGPIFNKGMMYKMYTGDLKIILDVQRSGQIPELVNEEHELARFTKKEAHVEFRTRMKWLKTRFPDQIGEYADFYKAEALGAVNHLGMQQAVQVKKYGVSAYQSEMDKAKMAAAAAAEAAKAKAKADYEKEHFTLLGGKVVLKKFKPIRKVA